MPEMALLWRSADPACQTAPKLHDKSRLWAGIRGTKNDTAVLRQFARYAAQIFIADFIIEEAEEREECEYSTMGPLFAPSASKKPWTPRQEI